MKTMWKMKIWRAPCINVKNAEMWKWIISRTIYFPCDSVLPILGLSYDLIEKVEAMLKNWKIWEKSYLWFFKQLYCRHSQLTGTCKGSSKNVNCQNVALILQAILLSTFTVNSKLISIWFGSSLVIATCVNTNL